MRRLRTLTTRETRGWVLAAVGCYWTRGEYTISTIATGDGSRRGYAVYRHGHGCLGEFLTWDEAERLAERRAGG